MLQRTKVAAMIPEEGGFAARFSPPKTQVNDFEIAGGKASTVLPFRLLNNVRLENQALLAIVEGHLIPTVLSSLMSFVSWLA
jgi:hypothetical protein